MLSGLHHRDGKNGGSEACCPLYLSHAKRALSNSHRHALREWLLALKLANVANLPPRRYSSVMRPLRYSIHVTLDGCVHHRAGSTDEELHRFWAEKLAQADAL